MDVLTEAKEKEELFKWWKVGLPIRALGHAHRYKKVQRDPLEQNSFQELGSKV